MELITTSSISFFGISREAESLPLSDGTTVKHGYLGRNSGVISKVGTYVCNHWRKVDLVKVIT